MYTVSGQVAAMDKGTRDNVGKKENKDALDGNMVIAETVGKRGLDLLLIMVLMPKGVKCNSDRYKQTIESKCENAIVCKKKLYFYFVCMYYKYHKMMINFLQI